MKISPGVLFLLGFLILFLGITGRLGVFLAALLTPDRVVVNG